MEKWKQIEGHPSSEVSNLGRVRKNGVVKRITGTATQRRVVYLIEKGDQTTASVSRLVGAAFCPDFREWLRPLYLDGDKRNCAASNLRWVTASEIAFRPIGELQGGSKLTAKDVKFIRRSKKPLAVLAKKYNVTRSAISDARRRESWKHI